MKSYNESYSENEGKGYIDNEKKSKYNGNDNEDEGKDNNGNDNNGSDNEDDNGNSNGNSKSNGNDNSNDKSENNVYWCFDEASEYKGWVIKLVLTTPVKF